MELGLAVSPRWRLTDIVDVAVVAESVGFSEIWVTDHYYLRDSFSCLSLIAAATDKLILGTGVASPFLRHPALLASASATLHELSGGRAVLGLGSGGSEFGQHISPGISRPLGAVRESVQIVRRLWTGENVSFKGEVFSTPNATLTFTPPQPPPPIYVAARGPRMVALAGEVAEGVITHGVGSDFIRSVRDATQQSSSATSRPRPLVKVMAGCVIDDSLDRARDALRRSCILMAGGVFADDLIDVYGLQRDEVLRLREAVSAGDWDNAEQLVTGSMVDAFCLAGPPERCRTTVDAIRKAGADGLIVATHSSATADHLKAKLPAIARALIG